MIFLADMAFQMSHFDDFDNAQISWKLAQREPFVLTFYHIFFLSSKSRRLLKYQMKPFEESLDTSERTFVMQVRLFLHIELIKKF